MHYSVLTVVHLHQLQEEWELWFSTVKEDTQILVVLIYFSDHKFEKVCIIGFVLLLSKNVVWGYKAFLTEFDEKVNQFNIFFEGLKEKLE